MSKPAVFPPPGDDQSEIEEGTVFTPHFDADGLVPVVTTSAKTGEVLMLAYMNDEALALTLKTGEAHYWSRSRNKLWRKGEPVRLLGVRLSELTDEAVQTNLFTDAEKKNGLYKAIDDVKNRFGKYAITKATGK